MYLVRRRTLSASIAALATTTSTWSMSSGPSCSARRPPLQGSPSRHSSNCRSQSTGHKLRMASGYAASSGASNMAVEDTTAAQTAVVLSQTEAKSLIHW